MVILPVIAILVAGTPFSEIFFYDFSREILDKLGSGKYDRELNGIKARDFPA
jgi:hypothetical protein